MPKGREREVEVAPVVTADQVLEWRNKLGRITTGSKKLDELIGGGVETQAVTEAFGQFGTGKTQLGHQLCVNVQLPLERGGLQKKAVFIDTENTFRPERIVSMAKALGLDPDAVLKNILYVRSYNTDQQLLIIEKLENKIEKENIGLIVVDSLTSHFRAEYTGRQMLADRQQKLNRHLLMLHRLADQYNIAVYVTNQVMETPDILYGDPTRPVGGHVLAHSVTTRIYLRKAKPPRRIARITDSPEFPEREAVFAVTEEGIRDEEAGGDGQK